MTHTPGPWRLSDASEQGFYGDNGELAVIGPELRICNVDCVAAFKRGEGYKAQCAERDANARLIAAAPDGLELAEEFLAFARSGKGFAYPPGGLQKLEQFIDKARGAS